MLHCVSTLRNQGMEMSRSWQQPTEVTGKVSYRFGGKVGWGLQPSPDREATGAAKPSLLLHKHGNGTVLGYERTPGKKGTALELAAHSSTTLRDAHSASLRRGLAESTSIHHLHPAWQKTFIPRISRVLSVGFNLQHFHMSFWATHSPAQPGAAAFRAPLLEGLGGSVLLVSFTWSSRITLISEPVPEASSPKNLKGQTTQCVQQHYSSL